MNGDSLRKLEFSKLSPKNWLNLHTQSLGDQWLQFALASIFPLRWAVCCVFTECGLYIINIFNQRFYLTTFVRFYLNFATFDTLRWLNAVLSVCECMSFAKSWQEKGCRSQAETWQVKNILMKDFEWQVKLDVFLVSMATWTIENNLKISLLLSLHNVRSLDFPINLHKAYYN